MKIIVKGCAKNEMRLKCRHCKCIFDVTRKDCKRRYVPYSVPVMGRWLEHYVNCPSCKHEINDFAW